MNFQESGAEVSQRIFTGCGKPKLGRRRRATTETKTTTERKPNDEISYESLNFSNKKKHKKIDNVPSLEKFIKEIKIVSILKSPSSLGFSLMFQNEIISFPLTQFKYRSVH